MKPFATAQVKGARIWAGVHYRNSCDVGEAVGVQIADYVLKDLLRPIENEDADQGESTAQ